MKRFLSLCLCLIVFSSLAQPVQVNRYEYWFNQQTEDKVIADIAPAEQASVQLNLPAVDLPDGLNSFSIRFRDNEDLWSSALTRFFVKMPVIVDGDGTDRMITALEYRFNHEELTHQPVTPIASFSFEESLGTAAIPTGLNSFSIRFRENSGIWSSMLTRFFVKIPQVDGGNGDPRQIVAYQYRFNQGDLVQQSVTAAADISIDEIISTADLPDGLNSFSVRFKDNAGLWSSVLTRFFVKLPVLQDGGEGNELTAYQVWFNNDTEGIQQTQIESGATFSLVETLSVATLPNGLNNLSIRFRDERGLWSGVLTKFFVKNPVAELPGENLMTAYEYWLEDAEGNFFDQNGQEGRTYVALEEPVSPMLLDLNLNLRMIPQGDYHLMFRFMDTRGSWSAVLAREIEKSLYPWAVINADETDLCAGGTVLFSNFSVDADTWLWDFGDGEQSTDFEPEHTYDEPGTYIVSLTASDLDTGMQHSTTLEINVYPEYEFTEEHQICEGDIFTWQGNEYITPGIFTVVYESDHGCDSVYVLNLAVIPAFIMEEYHDICEGEVFAWQGNEYSLPGTYEAIYESVPGCDSLYVLHLLVHPAYLFEESATICNGDTFIWFGQEYPDAGIYTHQLETEFGCDSLFVLELTVFTVDTSVEHQGNTLLALAQDAQYQWINCADGSYLEGEIAASFTPGQTGEYAVWITQTECTALSDCYEVLVSRISESDIFPAVSVFPNPAQNDLNIAFDELQENFSVALYSLSGQRLLYKENLSGNRYNISLENLQSGVYVLQIGYRGFNQVIKVVKE